MNLAITEKLIDTDLRHRRLDNIQPLCTLFRYIWHGRGLDGLSFLICKVCLEYSKSFL